jgi:hypothetical protein
VIIPRQPPRRSLPRRSKMRQHEKPSLKLRDESRFRQKKRVHREKPLFLLYNDQGTLCVIPNHWKAMYDFMKVPEQFAPAWPAKVHDVAGGESVPEDVLMKWYQHAGREIEIMVESTDPRFQLSYWLEPGQSRKFRPRYVRA